MLRSLPLCLIAWCAIATLCVSCSQGTQSSEAELEGDSTTTTSTVVTLYEDFKNPWGMAWLPDGRMLVTERAGEILVFKDDKYTGEKLSGVPEVFNQGQGGLLDITLHPNYKDNQWIYISYSKPVEGGATTAISRFKLNGNQVTELQELFTAKPYI